MNTAGKYQLRQRHPAGIRLLLRGDQSNIVLPSVHLHSLRYVAKYKQYVDICQRFVAIKSKQNQIKFFVQH